MIEKLIEAIKEVNKPGFDSNDLGNAIGMVVSESLSKEDLEAFKSGLDHGFSIGEGTHDNPENTACSLCTLIDWDDISKEIKEYFEYDPDKGCEIVEMCGPSGVARDMIRIFKKHSGEENDGSQGRALPERDQSNPEI